MSFKWLPNALTIMRCFGAFVVGWVILRYGAAVVDSEALFDASLQNALDELLALHGDGAVPPFEATENLLAQMQVLNWIVITPFILFVIVAASDFLDGYFARKLNAVSAFGAFLDPVADKLLVAVSLIAVAYVLDWYWIILLPAIVIIARDSYVTLLRLRPNVKLPVSKLAKYKTALEMAGIGGVLLAWAVPGFIGLMAHPDSAENYIMDATLPIEILSIASLALIYLAAALSAYTGWLYVRSAMAKA
jgi:CDP-diacylglycerol--glycerol-3-phosphate 3-phosphatidyltransferase